MSSLTGKEGATVVSAPARLHLGLHDCGYATSRVFGGAGITIDGFPTVAVARSASKTRVSYDKRTDPSDRTLSAVDELLDRLTPITGNFVVKVASMAPEHKGFGSKTSLLMAISKAAVLASERGGLTNQEIVSLTGRGGTSGIGINSFWRGGLIADGGHVSEGPDRVFQPSSRRQAIRMAPMVARVAMPPNWRVQLFFDPQAELIEGDLEMEIFRDNLPLPDTENLRAMAATYHGVIPAAHEQDLPRFADAIRDLNGTGMKRLEVALQSEVTQTFLSEGWENNQAVGLTSFGPTVYHIFDGQEPSAAETVAATAAEYGLTSLGVHTFNNRGADINYPLPSTIRTR